MTATSDDGRRVGRGKIFQMGMHDGEMCNDDLQPTSRLSTSCSDDLQPTGRLSASCTMLPADADDAVKDLESIQEFRDVFGCQGYASVSTSPFDLAAEGESGGQSQTCIQQHSPATHTVPSLTSSTCYAKSQLLPSDRSVHIEKDPTQALHDLRSTLENHWPTQTSLTEGMLTATVFIEFVAVEVTVKVHAVEPLSESCTLVFRDTGVRDVVRFSNLCQRVKACLSGNIQHANSAFDDDDDMDCTEPGEDFVKMWWVELASATSSALRLELLQSLATWTETSEDCSSAVAQNVCHDELTSLLGTMAHLAELYPLSVILRNAARSPASIKMAHVASTIAHAIYSLPPSIASQELAHALELLSEHGMGT